MTSFLTVLIALWTFPVATYIIVRLTRNNIRARSLVIRITSLITFITILGLIFNVSTTVKEIDWIALTSIYFSICLALWYFYYSNNKLVKVLAILIMLAVFGIGYLSSTLGVLGVGFVIAENEPSYEIHITERLIYKETYLGNAITDYRGKRVEIYKTVSLLPFIERRILHKEYFKINIFHNHLNIDYRPELKLIYLNASEIYGERLETWADTLRLE